MAHLCGDPSFIEAFQNGEDIHSRTAREILTDGEEPKSDDRRKAKAINFGILYGLSEFGLAKQLDISRTEAREFITKYFARYPGIRTYLDQAIEGGKEKDTSRPSWADDARCLTSRAAMAQFGKQPSGLR